MSNVQFAIITPIPIAKGSTYGNAQASTRCYSFQIAQRSSGFVYRNRDEVFSSKTTIRSLRSGSIISA
jgi:hypothetical protein